MIKGKQAVLTGKACKTEGTDMNRCIYIKCNAHAKVNCDKVILKDVAEVYCEDNGLQSKARVIPLTGLKEKGSRKVLSVLYIMEQIQKVLPGTEVRSIGETDVIVEWENRAKGDWFKITFISLIAFFGTAFTIMAFHNDIGIRSVFEEIYNLATDNVPEGIGIIEISYCLGLFVGITVFFNHLGKKKLHGDPTPISVAMHNYEKDVNQAIVENADRRKEEKTT